MLRREFIAGLGSAAVWPVVARAQAAPPVIGFLAQGTPEGSAEFVSAVRKGLSEAGLAEGKDFTSEFRWARFNADLLSVLAVDLVQRRIAVIITLDTVPAARAAKTVTKDVPIVFTVGTDPVQAGLVAKLNQPGGNVTGISTMNLDLAPKWVGLLRELRPSAKRFAVLVNVANAGSARSLITGTQQAVLSIGMQVEFVFASDEGEIDAASLVLGRGRRR
jgi:putative ABC transport system substrate-binding protein